MNFFEAHFVYCRFIKKKKTNKDSAKREICTIYMVNYYSRSSVSNKLCKHI